MFNPLKTNAEDTEQLFEVASEDILINDKPSKGIITEFNYYNDSEDKNLHTIDSVTTGDYITVRDEGYLVVNETITKRHHKYKTLIRHCNFDVVINKNPIPAIVKSKTFSIDGTYAIRVADKKMDITVVDNEDNRDDIKVNEEFQLFNYKWKIIDIDLTQRGLITFTSERGSAVS